MCSLEQALYILTGRDMIFLPLRDYSSSALHIVVIVIMDMAMLDVFLPFEEILVHPAFCPKIV
jgi:uncharacterized membrane protein YdfJ with MMPL/SSD domain